jgi:two-component system, NtrC family, sensor histidine kinase HydH
MLNKVRIFQSDRQESTPHHCAGVRKRVDFPRVQKLGRLERSSVIEKLYRRSLFTASDLRSFQRQETVFIGLNMGFLTCLFALQLIFSSYWGRPTVSLVLVIGVVLLLNAVEWAWVRGLHQQPKAGTLTLLTWSSICLSLLAAAWLTILLDHEDTPYFSLVIVPVLVAAFRLSLPALGGVVGVATFLNFALVDHFFRHHPPADSGEFFEAGINSLIFAIAGLLAWLLVKQIREHESNLASNLLELKRARAKLLEEETLAAVGRLSSAIAHEIRNPVAMISSSLAMAHRCPIDSEQREEMCEIAAREADRLEKLTTEFLRYARPRPPETSPTAVLDTLEYVASVCRAHATDRQVAIAVEAAESLEAELDPAQIQQALLNLVMNAVDASPRGGKVWLKADWDGFSEVQVWVTNRGSQIPETVLSRIFEPFFTTKARGTGLGLAIARNIARAHGGELSLCSNEPDNICFCLRLPAATAVVGGGTRDLTWQGF